MDAKRILTTEYDQQYPIFSMVLAYVLILLTPFLSSLTSYAAFAICLYRIIRYDSKVFATDYALLLPITTVFRTSGGLTLTVFLCLIAAVVYVIREGLQANRLLVILLLLLNYLLLRMQMNIDGFVLCFGQLFALYALLPKQDAQSAERTLKGYCYSLLLAAAYVMAFRGTGQLRAMLGDEGEAIWGSGIMRFHGMMRDPNYYMTTVTVGLASLAKLKETGRLKLLPFVIMGICLIALGVLTYSKAFFLALVLFALIYIIWQFRNKRIFVGVVLVVVAILAADALLLSENSPFAVVIARFLNSEDISDLTTGRTDIYLQYIRAILKNPLTFLFGYGMGTPELEKAPHNVYIEIVYYTGIVGFALFTGFVMSLIKTLKVQLPDMDKQSAISKYIALLMIAVLYFSLHGIFRVDFYGNVFLAFLAMIVTEKQESDAEA